MKCSVQVATVPTFGQLLRALRFRFNWSSRHGCFIRMKPEGKNVVIQLHPPALIPNSFKGSKGDTYFLWWDKPEVLEHVPALQHVRGVKKAIQFSVDAESGIRV